MNGGSVEENKELVVNRFEKKLIFISYFFSMVLLLRLLFLLLPPLPLLLLFFNKLPCMSLGRTGGTSEVRIFMSCGVLGLKKAEY